MATLRHFPFLAHLRAEPNEYVLHYRSGRLVAHGAGLAYWFAPLSASVAQVPVEDIETSFVVQERTRDFQEVNAQVALRYRCVAPEKAARRVNFGLHLGRGVWLEQPLEKLASFWAQRAARPARGCLCAMSVTDAVRSGAEGVQAAIEAELRADAELLEMGLALVAVHVVRVAPSAEVERALQTPEREAIQQKADEASFSRRALAVEKERAIQENELNNKVELARKEELLISQEGSNALLRVGHEAAAERARVVAQADREQLLSVGAAQSAETRAGGEARARSLLSAADLEAEARRVAVYRDAPGTLPWAMAAQQLATKITTIQHLNITPDLLGSAFQDLLRSQGNEGS